MTSSESQSNLIYRRTHSKIQLNLETTLIFYVYTYISLKNDTEQLHTVNLEQETPLHIAAENIKSEGVEAIKLLINR